MIRLAPLLAFMLFLSGCSVAAYAPVVTMSALGFDKKNLNEDIKYKHAIGKPIILNGVEDRIWTLRKFSQGRYFIELSLPNNNSTPFVCTLAGKEIFITVVFEDTINGGIHYSARVKCDNGPVIETTRNHWYEEIHDLAHAAKMTFLN